jgi:Fe-S-cluster containining protein
MDLIKESDAMTGGGKLRACFPATSEERFVKAIHVSVDEAIARGLERLRADTGRVPTCKVGCCHCCRFPILMNIAEARTLAQFVKREFSPEETERLRLRTLAWHQWDNALRGRLLPAPMAGEADDPPDTPPCPMLVESKCSAYEVRPLVCRNHFVLSPPGSCHGINDPGSPEAPPKVIESIKAATGSYATAMKDYIEKAGLDYCRTMTLLPHGLAAEMGWDLIPVR